MMLLFPKLCNRFFCVSLKSNFFLFCFVLLLYSWFNRAQFCWCIVCHLKHLTSNGASLSECLLSVLARFSRAQQFGLDKHQRACVLLRISRNDMGSLVRGSAFWYLAVWAVSLILRECSWDTRDTFPKYPLEFGNIYTQHNVRSCSFHFIWNGRCWWYI